jgi:hypothetical protein
MKIFLGRFDIRRAAGFSPIVSLYRSLRDSIARPADSLAGKSKHRRHNRFAGGEN